MQKIKIYIDMYDDKNRIKGNKLILKIYSDTYDKESEHIIKESYEQDIKYKMNYKLDEIIKKYKLRYKSKNEKIRIKEYYSKKEIDQERDGEKISRILNNNIEHI